MNIDVEDFKLTGEFKVSICGPDNLFFIGHDAFDFIARSDDGIHWIPLDTMESCVLCKVQDKNDFRFNELLLKIVDKCNIPLEIYLENDDICIRYSENANSNILQQFSNIQQN